MPNLPSELERFVYDALGRNLDRDTVARTLGSAGWPKDQIDRALGAYSDVDFPIPVPRPQPYLSAREAFVYLTMFLALGLAAFNFGAILFELIQNALPEPGDRTYFTTLTWNLAYLIVAFPVFVVLTVHQSRAMDQDPTKRASKIRKWLIYLTLFVAAGFIVGDLVSLVYHLLEGEMTIRFVLKVGVVAAIAGTIFAYYLRDLGKDEQ